MLQAQVNQTGTRADTGKSQDLGPLAGRILLVEDVEDMRLLFRHVLQKAGLTVDLANNGEEACKKAIASREADEPYDVILMDVQMPRMDGYEATRELRDQGWDGPIIALTAFTATEDRGQWCDAGCNAHVDKSSSWKQLLSAVVEHLDSRT